MDTEENEVQMPVQQLADESQWHSIRVMRDAYLRSTDWLVLKYQETQGAIPEELKQYRQALRDLPQAFSSPNEVAWPVKPEL
ncbi:phage tail assembly chaperone [Pseudoalteromonas sp. OOF1S-7]|uniref:phage tail assembly chaperone n=1 Tax=Pseudoalteromonas sp. OOF1S-7 TaxID=2917757 RepID=UPI001EF6BA6E|nr:phage tail assembly chaperone [Pseudoalteromonas sp. OOF1S-7]MCG7536487.1 phage tail assembly chaperone [Pseudoalteromonas sp. OOF1S-7]